MSQIHSDSAFAVLSFLAAPAILTNASTILALGTSNRLARAADRARLAAISIVSSPNVSDPLVVLQQQDFQNSTRRATLLIQALRRFYLAAGAFAAATCIALLGAFADYFHITLFDPISQVATIVAALVGVGGLAHGAVTLLQETRIALQSLDLQHAAITKWRATHTAGLDPPSPSAPPPPDLSPRGP